MGDESNGEGISKPIAIKMLLHFRNHPDVEYGTREIQRILDIKSSSTTSSYLNQLKDLELLEKSSSNLYKLTQKGKTFNELAYPVFQNIQYYNGKFLPKYSFLLSFLFFSFIITTILLVLKINLGIVVMNSLISLMVTFFILLQEWNDSRKQYFAFLDMHGLGK